MIVPQVEIPLTARDQGSRGSCVAFSIAGIKGSYAAHELSPEYAYLATVHESPNWRPNEGLDIRVAIEATKAGLPEEASYPYQQKEPSHPLPILPTDLALYGRHLSLLQPDLSMIKSYLNTGRAVGALIALTQSFINPKDGLVTFEAATFQMLHAVVIVGFGVNPAGEEHYLICNSWGTSWGNDGHAWLPGVYISNHATCIYGANP